jgi:hypothetical protein
MRVRAVYLWHRYLGIALCLIFLAWFVSGVVMLYVRMPILFPAERFSLLEEIDSARVALTPAEAVTRAGFNAPPRRVRLIALNERPLYLLLPRGGRWTAIFADNGERLADVSPEVARAIAHQRAGRGSMPRFVGTVAEIDQWTLTNSLNLHRPLHRLAFDDELGTELYVSSVTGEIVMRTTSRERALAWIGPIMHWGAPEILRTRVPLWRQSMLWISGAGMVLTLTGLAIGTIRFRRRGYRLRAELSKSPYIGVKRWHHWGGLAFGAVTFTWIVSGWLYLNPGGNRSSPLETVTTMSPYNVGGMRADNSSVPQHALALSGGPLDGSLFTLPVTDAWRRARLNDRPREIELTRVGGEPYYIFYADWNHSTIVPAAVDGGPAFARFENRVLENLAARMIAGATLTELTLVDSYDAYYYSVGAVAPKRLPVLLAKFDDPARTWYYIDPHTGSIFRRYDRHGRVMRWLVNGLHTFDLPILFAHRPAWDLAIILPSAGGFALSLTGLIIGWRRVRGHRMEGNVRHATHTASLEPSAVSRNERPGAARHLR